MGVTRDGVFGFEVAITSQKTSFDGHVMVPTAAKISFKVDNFPYAAGAKNLAVKMWLLTDSIADDWNLQQPGRHAHHHPFISGRGSKNGGFFSWNGTVIADGFSHDVKEHFEANTGNEDVEISTDARISTVWFTLATGNDAPTNIFWDPSLGYGAVNEGTDGLNLASPAIIALISSGLAVMVVAAVAVVVIIALRRKRKVPGDVSKDVYAPIA